MENLSHSSRKKQHALPTVSREAFLIYEAIWGDIDARNEILISYLPFIRRLARQVSGTEATYELSDISNYWCFLFLDKFEKYNPELWNIAVFIKTYVFPEMKDYALNLRNIVSVPMGTKVEITENGGNKICAYKKITIWIFNPLKKRNCSKCS
jgi:DNA-directed RNA polymerase specialized sigma subunit